MASWADEGLLLNIGNSSDIDGGYFVFCGTSYEIDNQSILPATFTFPAFLLNIGNESIPGVIRYSFYNYAKKAVLIAGSGGSYYNTGIFNNIAKKAVLAFEEYDTTGNFAGYARKGTLVLSHGGRFIGKAKRSILTAYGYTPSIGTFNGKAKRAILSITGFEGTLGSFSGIAKRATIEITGLLHTSGAFAGTAYKGVLQIASLATVFECIVVCLDNTANTNYTNYGFNSLIKFGDMILATDDNGIYQIGGDTDAEVAIPVTIQTPKDDFGIDNHKVVLEAITSFKGGPLLITLNDDIAQELPATTEFMNRRAKPGKGIRKRRYWQATIQNKDGSRFSMDSLTLIPFGLQRKVTNES